jgi:small subunit ribosomal protein S20
MAHSLSAKKRIRQNIKSRARNRWRKTALRTSVKEFEERVLHGTQDEAKVAFHKACRLLDKSASKGVIHRNTAARKKSRLANRLKGMAA